MVVHLFSRKKNLRQLRLGAGQIGTLALVFLMLSVSTGILRTVETLAAASNPPADHAIIRQVSIDENNVISYIKENGLYTFGRSGGVKRQVAIGDPAPRAGGHFARFLDLDSATLKTTVFGDELNIVFKAEIEGGQVREGIFLFSETRGIDAIALPGDIAPDTGGGAFSGFQGRLVISDVGTVMFKATVTGGTASEGLFFAPRGFILGEADVDSVAVQGDPAPETGGGAFASFSEFDLVEDIVSPFPAGVKLDRFAFIATVEGGQSPEGLFLSTFLRTSVLPLQFELLTRAVALPGGAAGGLRGVSYTAFKDVALTKHELVYRATLEGGEASEGIFQTALLAAGFIEISSPKALAGEKAPVVGTNVTFVRFGRLVGNDQEQLVFEAELQGEGPSVGLFLVTLGPLTLMSETLSVGDVAPKTNGGTYRALGPISISDDGFIVLQADIEGGTISEGLFRSLARQDRFIDGIPR